MLRPNRADFPGGHYPVPFSKKHQTTRPLDLEPIMHVVYVAYCGPSYFAVVNSDE